MQLNPLRWLFRSRRDLRRDRALVRVLMVCRANICRSPMAEGAFGRLVAQAGLGELIFVDSAGTHVQVKGIAPDMRGQKTAAQRDTDLRLIRTRKVTAADLDEFELVIAMDRSNYDDLMELAVSDNHRSRIKLMLQFAERPQSVEVPDPYYGGTAGFERVMDLLEQAAVGLLNHIRRERNI